MQMNITFRHVDPIDSLKSYSQEKVDKVERYLDRASEAHVVLSVEKHHHQADITIHSGPYMLRGKERSQDMYASIDLVFVAKALERVGDHAKNLAEQVIYIVKGTDVRHTPPEGLESAVN